MPSWGKQAWAVVLFAAAGIGCQAVLPQPQAAHRTALSTSDALSLADDFFLTQNRSDRYNPAQPPGSNANCGPASLAMALKAFGREPKDLAAPAQAHDLVKYVRKVMTGAQNEQTWTYPSQVEHGAQLLGLKAELVFSSRKILEAMQEPGRMVVVNLNPTPAYVDQLTVPYDGGHFALVTAVNGQQICLNDPLAAHPINISQAQLDEALTTSLGTDPYGRMVPAYNGGVALSP
ncbi:MAG: hypothetical protein JWM80_2536 [Cyanobacteria bacterium RYN_339]|nr:hypothetical protein [Cyanobacteria bacterium RYN_339]